ncbi:UNVERIFIED_CONTAM: hypothetical protein GTU68_001744 [Idotea baltica]|nr:hypothetical protein [Idotea baltica]
MKILLTGGAGFIGSHVFDKLNPSNEILILDNLSKGRKSNLKSAYNLIEIDINDKKTGDIISDFNPNIIIHTAAQTSVSNSLEKPETDVKDNILASINILNNINQDLEHFIFFSSGGAIYGDQIEFPATEDHPIQPISPYGISKRYIELYLEYLSKVKNLNYTSLRLSNVYGPRQRSDMEGGVIAIFIENLIKNIEPKIYGNGEQTRDFIYVEDIAKAVESIINKKVYGTYNLSSNKEISINSLKEIVLNELNSNLNFKHLNQRSGEVLRSYLSSKKAFEAFSWKAKTELKEGILKTINYFQNQ